MNREAETQRRRAKPRVAGKDFAGFESPPASPSFLMEKAPAIALWGGTISTMLGALYMIEGSTFLGSLFIIIGALFIKVVNDA
jgi:hypothetical protein